jgi:hypothetical protein
MNPTLPAPFAVIVSFYNCLITFFNRFILILFFLYSGASSVFSQTVTFSTPGTSTWTVPAGVTSITVQAWGAGGGGSKGFSSLKGTGGGGGGFAQAVIAVTPGTVINVTVGAGGAGANAAGNGGAGGNSTVSFSTNTLTAFGGGGGISTNAPSGTGGAGGSNTGNFSGAWTSTVSYCGGYGANISVPGSPSPGGGAGGAAGETANGRNAGGAVSNCSSGGSTQNGGAATSSGGAGGDGGTGNANGSNGTIIGGGGGGNAGNGIGGNGAAGRVVISYFLVLPVTISNFYGVVENCSVKLYWVTASETNFSHFEIQESSDGLLFKKIGMINSNQVSSGSSYQFNDNRFKEITFYRLMMVDINGNYSFSSVITIRNKCEEKQISFFPNPVRNSGLLTVNINGFTESLTGELISIAGNTVQQFLLKNGINNLALKNITAGLYLFRTRDKANNITTYKIQVLE